MRSWSTVIDVTSADRLYRSWQAELRAASASARPADLAGRTGLGRLLSGAAGIPAMGEGATEPLDAPIVTVHNASSHALAWVGAALVLLQYRSASTSSASPALSRTSVRTLGSCPTRSRPHRW